MLLQRLLQPLERYRDFLRGLMVVRLGLGMGCRGHRIGEGGHIIDPGAVHRALDRIIGVQPRRDHFVQILGNGIRFEQGYPIVDAQHRHFLVRRDGEEPIRPVVRLDVAELEVDVFFSRSTIAAR